MTSAATREPRSAAARRAAGETGPPPADPDGEQEDRPDPETVQEREDLELAREEARLAREEAQQMREELERIRLAAVAAPDVGPSDAPPPSDLPGSPAAPASVVPRGRDDGQITPEERAMVLRVREARKREILEGIKNAPGRIGIDLDQFTLVHLRGCPNPDRTETYEARNTSTGEEFTIHRCIECGAHLPIPH